MGWEEQVRRVVPYIPGEQPKQKGIIKLNTNECPYPPSPLVKEYAAAFETELLRLYPDPEASLLVNALADYYGVDADQVFVGVGSDDVLAMSFLTFFNSEKPVLFPDITYSFYDVWAELFHIPYRCPELDNDFRLVKEDYLTENGGIVILNPNAPTGLFESLDTIEEIVVGNPDSMVIIDEAYVDFGGESCVSLTGRYPNLLVVQTYSKSRSMAGARLGYAIGDAALIQDLETIKFSTNPYNVNRLTLKAGAQALAEQAYYDKNCQTIMETRAYTTRELEKLGFTVLPSQTNFLFARKPGVEGADVYRRLKERGVLVRHFDKERIRDYNRITIGTREQMDILLEKLREFL